MTAPTPREAERQAFEAYSRNRPDGGFTLERMSDGRYTHYNAQWAWETWQAARAALAVPAAQPTAKQILQAVARGWTHGPNQHKEMDADLAIAIAAEVSALFDDAAIAAMKEPT